MHQPWVIRLLYPAQTLAIIENYSQSISENYHWRIQTIFKRKRETRTSYNVPISVIDREKWKRTAIPRGILRRIRFEDRYATTNRQRILAATSPPPLRIVSRNLRGISARSANYFECASSIGRIKIRFRGSCRFLHWLSAGNRRILEYPD